MGKKILDAGISRGKSSVGKIAELQVFKSAEIGGVTIKNRLVRSATFEGMASEDGHVTDSLVELYKNLARGGVGLIITGNIYVQPSGKSAGHQMGIDRDELVLGLRRIAETVHKYGDGCKVAPQIFHSGRQSFVLENTVAPSAVLEPVVNKMPREMTAEEIEETIEAFAEAVRRAKDAGFDAVQLHSAHGYLLSEFLSPYTNRRTDEYGGSTENRVRILEEIYKRSVERAGKDFPILTKMNVDDFMKGGITLNESKKIAKRLSKRGFAAIETSGGMWETATRSEEELGWKPAFPAESRTKITSKDKEAYWLPYDREIKKVIDVPLILVGGIRSLDVAEKILAEGSADFISLSRPLIREPDLPNKWLKSIGELTAECTSCNNCFISTVSGGLRCIPEERAKQKSS
jgi:2,4-dienoyl-CoA reductase-like NADH-dependent reductase (Old Yellow Enzyme family)